MAGLCHAVDSMRWGWPQPQIVEENEGVSSTARGLKVPHPPGQLSSPLGPVSSLGPQAVDLQAAHWNTGPTISKVFPFAPPEPSPPFGFFLVPGG